MKSARQEILEKLKTTKHSLPDTPDFETPVYHPIEKPLPLVFKESLEKVNGSVYLFETEDELFSGLQNLLNKFSMQNICCCEHELQKSLKKHDLPFSPSFELNDNIEAGITNCEFLIAHTGSIMVCSAQAGERQMFVYPPVHIVIANKNQVVDYLESAYSRIVEKYKENIPSQLTIITGPSRTADIEKTLILGAHGPKELHVFLV